MRKKTGNGNDKIGNDKIMIVSTYTQTLGMIGKICHKNNWGFCQLDNGTV